MLVGEMRKLIDGADDNMKILIPISNKFDGCFYSPCNVDSGISQIGTDPEMGKEEIEEAVLLNKPIPEEDVLLLLPCGFDEESNHKHELN